MNEYVRGSVEVVWMDGEQDERENSRLIWLVRVLRREKTGTKISKGRICD